MGLRSSADNSKSLFAADVEGLVGVIGHEFAAVQLDPKMLAQRLLVDPQLLDGG